MASIYINKDFNDYLIGNLYIENNFNHRYTKFVKIQDTLTSIGLKSFYNCSALISVIIPDTITSINNNTFHLCHRLKSISIPNSVISINDYAFYCCSSLKSIIIPNSVTSIGQNAFCNCASLTALTIPKRFETRMTEIFYEVDLSKVSITYTYKL
jgi:hypothetical protein